jgi:hypothetical protein
MYKRNPGILAGNKKFKGKNCLLFRYFGSGCDPYKIIPVDPDPGKPNGEKKNKNFNF